MGSADLSNLRFAAFLMEHVPPRYGNSAKMKAILYPFLFLAAIGLALSALVHVGAWAGLEPPSAAMGLHLGIFAVWLPAVIVSHRLARDYKQRDWWRATFRGAPRWFEKAVKVLGAYALVNFAVFLFLSARGDGPVSKVNEFRGFSGHWMIFYAAAFSILYSAIHVEEVARNRACLNGHQVSAVAKYCEQCGSPVVDRMRT
jgi:hypothetical protein